jgi:membrane protein DedA with SNARE-associated domain
VPAWIVDLFARYGYAVVFVGVFLENTGLPWVIATAIVGAILGDNLGFLIGRRGGRALVERFGAKLGLTSARLIQFDRFFDRHGAKTVFIARFVTGLRVFGAVLAGTSGLSWGRFVAYNASGAVAWATTFGIIGYLLAFSWQTLETWIGRAGFALLALVIIAGLVVVLRKRQSPL